ncbi:MAG: polysaccharide biosynthesis C-terminal domain-containing protein [Deltaproteobacteria bacterium]|nr:polysaccharide biosynthesis C-terminal domain-containing protein [Deltaproteobacteria bacterium]
MDFKLNRGKIARLIIETYATRVFNLAVLFVSDILISRMIGTEGRGYVGAAKLWAMLACMVFTFGLDSTAIYYTGASHGRFHRLARQYLGYAAVAFFFGAVMLWGVDHLKNLFGNVSGLYLLTVGLFAAALLTALFNALFIGIGRLSFTNKLLTVGSGLLLASLIFIYFSGYGRITTVLQVILLSQAVNVILLVTWAFRIKGLDEPKEINRKEFARYSVTQYVSNIGGFFYMRGSAIILTLVASMSEVGLYSIAQVMTDMLLILPNILINIVFPATAGMERPDAIRRISETARFCSTISLIGLLALSLAAFFIVPLLFGPAFKPAVGMIWVLAAGAWMAAVSMVLSIYFNVTNQPRIPAFAVWIGFATSAALTVLLAPHWGGYGAAIALVLSRFAVLCYMLTLYVRESEENVFDLLFLSHEDWRRGGLLLKGMLG